MLNEQVRLDFLEKKRMFNSFFPPFSWRRASIPFGTGMITKLTKDVLKNDIQFHIHHLTTR